MQEAWDMQVSFLGSEDPEEEEIAIHSSILEPINLVCESVNLRCPSWV